ncbi:MAG: tetratricopeptide repeat protein [Deltaproteobacteria bacterium]|jgi:predicted TPR repeat methyltransferase|nr:tetratricopeptide repeat protein [Deltaproteobacteria bacterium]MBW2537151.1 tetratricopeptide repeat protein [Deltaproteobacteria bacterium]
MSSARTADQERRLQQAAELVEAGRLEEAAARYEAILEGAPDQPDALHHAGLIAYQQGDLPAAIERLQRAVSAAPDEARVHCNLGLALRAAGDSDGARQCCERALAVEPGFGQAHYHLGVLAFEAEDYDEARDHYRAAIAAEPEFREAHYNLAHALQKLGQEREAIDAYRRAVEADPGYERAWLNLANALHSAERWTDALGAYRSYLELRPDQPSAAHMVAAIEGHGADRCPRQFVEDLFDSYADEFDQLLVEDLGYQTPGQLARLVADDDRDRRFDRALDLGCGTGLVGAELRSRCRHLTGVDLSGGMIAEAERRGVYDELRQADLVEFLDAATCSFDLIVAADVFVYLGDLEPCVAAARGAAVPNARFAFSTEAGRGESEGFTLLRTGRFAHQRSYVEGLAARQGFTVLGTRDLILRQDHGRPIRGHLFLLAC